MIIRGFSQRIFGIGAVTLAVVGCDGGAGAGTRGADGGAPDAATAPGDGSADAGATRLDAHAPDSGRQDTGPEWADDRCPVEAPEEPPAPLRTFYVAADTGDDANDGLTPATAWRTIDAANDAATEGDLFVLSGTFSAQSVRPRRSGMAEAKIVYRASAPGAAMIRETETALDLGGLSHVVVDGVAISATGGSAVDLQGASDVWVRRLVVEDAHDVRLYNARDTRVEDSTFNRCRSNCASIMSGSTGNLLRGNHFGDAGGRDVWVTGTATSNVLRGNTFSNETGSALSLASDGSVVECNTFDGSSAIAVWVGGADNVVRLNLVRDNGGEGITIRSHTDQSISRNVIAYNTIVGNGGPCMRMNLSNLSTMEDNLIAYNLCWGNNRKSNIHWENHGHQYKVVVDQFHATNKWPVGDLHGNVLVGNLFGKDTADIGTRWMWFIGETTVRLTLTEAEAMFGDAIRDNLELDPLFVDEAAGDLRLLPESPALDHGEPMDGIWYTGAAPDLGRFERTAVGEAER